MGSVISFFLSFPSSIFPSLSFRASGAGPSVRVFRVVAVGRSAGRGRVSTMPVPVSLRNREKNKETKCVRGQHCTLVIVSFFQHILLFLAPQPTKGAYLTLLPTILLHNLKMGWIDFVFSEELLSRFMCENKFQKA